jgi:hypothetical protein
MCASIEPHIRRDGTLDAAPDFDRDRERGFFVFTGIDLTS